MSYSNLGIAYHLPCQCGNTVEYHTLHLAIAKEVGDREGVAYSNIGSSYVQMHQYTKAVSSYKAGFDMISQLDLAREKAKAASEVGTAS